LIGSMPKNRMRREMLMKEGYFLIIR